MEAADPEKQQRFGKGSSMARKPFSDLTNLIPKPHLRSTSLSQSKKPVTSADHTMSSIGSNQIHSLVQHQFTVPKGEHHLPSPQTPSPVTLNVARTQKRQYDSVPDGKHIAYTESQKMPKTRSMPPKYPPMLNTINTEPLSGMNPNNKVKPVVDSSFVHLSKKHEGMKVATPINYEVNGTEISSLSNKSTKVHLPNNKKRSRSSKGISKKFVLPQDFIDQQKTYFKEIDEYELQVEEADQLST
ncbi:hypothetical protein LXL04_012175 [Taraxacum kok-saghyz]